MILAYKDCFGFKIDIFEKRDILSSTCYSMQGPTPKQPFLKSCKLTYYNFYIARVTCNTMGNITWPSGQLGRELFVKFQWRYFTAFKLVFCISVCWCSHTAFLSWHTAHHTEVGEQRGRSKPDSCIVLQGHMPIALPQTHKRCNKGAL
jgi:hypothetical protein